MRSTIVTAAQLAGYFRFRSALKNPEQAQLQRLKSCLKSLSQTESARRFDFTAVRSYDDFVKRVPTTDYSFWENDILEQKDKGGRIVCGEIQRYQPTSGSTSAQKWIPYTKPFMSEMDAAIEPWLADVGFTNPKAFQGSQYWSLSWLPQDQRDSRPSNDDLELLPGWKRYLFEKLMAVPSSVTFTNTMEDSQFATLAYLCSRSDLSLVSVWSPTFWLMLMNHLEEWRELLSLTLDTGEWQLPGWSSKLKAPQNSKAANCLRTLHGRSLTEALWPRLSLISCWDSAGSQSWAEEIRRRHPTVAVQGKGLWATEGVITIPFRNQFPAAVTSHFLEWMDLETNTIVPTWKLKKDQVVQPLLTGGHGLLRYRLNDGMKVNGFLQNTPTFEFQGRLRETDLVGEKLSRNLTLETFDSFEQTFGIRPVSMLAVRTQTKLPYYLVLVQDIGESSQVIEKMIEDSLSRVFHYKLARELGQLGHAKVLMNPRPESVYQQAFVRKGMLTGDIKLEPLAEISEEFLL